jgi:hypothetical protein
MAAFSSFESQQWVDLSPSLLIILKRYFPAQAGLNRETVGRCMSVRLTISTSHVSLYRTPFGAVLRAKVGGEDRWC